MERPGISSFPTSPPNGSTATSNELPIEILMVVISLAAASSPRVAVNLSLVSHEVQRWSDSHLFKNIVIQDSHIPRAMEVLLDSFILKNASARFLQARNYVRTFSTKQVKDNKKRLPKFISRCPNLFSIALWNYPLPLGISSLIMPSLRRVAFPNTRGLSFESPIFRTVTHLELVNWDIPIPPSLGLQSMKYLTHLILSPWGFYPLGIDQAAVELFPLGLQILFLALKENGVHMRHWPPRRGTDIKYLLPVTGPNVSVPGIENLDVYGDEAFKVWSGEIPEEESFWVKGERLLQSSRRL
ncbi:hypothetical protein DL96DRAFT_1621936 [Flagelloscypha sp. PMI_526]|nr:hypothetical protein DL96DRAFT_1621936 [Flagelloscypha sp. PMI_526]